MWRAARVGGPKGDLFNSAGKYSPKEIYKDLCWVEEVRLWAENTRARSM